MFIKSIKLCIFCCLLAFFIAGCNLPVATPVSVFAPTLPLTRTPTITSVFPPTLSPADAPTPTLIVTPQPWSAIRRVIIISIDGLRPDAIDLAPMPTVQALMASGAYSLQAQTVYPSGTLPAHASMLTGQCPDKHGIDWNDYLPGKGYALGIDIFDLVHAAGMQTVMYAGKEKLQQVTEPASLDIFEYINDRDKVIIARLIENFPENFGLLFIHFPTNDWMGHEHGWLSWQQLSVLRRADEAIADLLNELDKRNLRNETLIIISADHGGHDDTHGTRRPEDMTIPWIINGPGVQPNVLIAPIQTMDTAATAAWALGFSIPPEWDGIPIVEAFGLPARERSSIGCP